MIRAYALLFIALPLAVVAACIIVSMLIPGCKLDEGSGASGCGAIGPLLANGTWGGFAVLVCGLMGMVPIGIFRGIVGLFQASSPRRDQPVEPTRRRE